MEIYLTGKGERLRIPLLPDRLNVKMGTLSASFQVIKKGEFKIPRGTSLTGYSWNGVFPGEGMANASFVFDWQPPNRIVALLQRWMEENTIIQIMVTETTINDTVYIENFVFEHFGVDNVSYTLNLTKYRPLIVTTAPPQPEVVIPTQAEESTTKAESTKPKTTSTNASTKKAQQGTKKGNTGKKKLSVTIPTKNIAKAYNVASKKIVCSVETKKPISRMALNNKVMNALK